MHEFSLAQNILEIVEENARRNNFNTITEVVLEIGTLSGVEIPALDMAIESLKPGSVLQEATITRQIIEARAKCMACRSEFAPADYFTACPKCGSYGPEIIRGKDLRVKSITAE